MGEEEIVETILGTGDWLAIQTDQTPGTGTLHYSIKNDYIQSTEPAIKLFEGKHETVNGKKVYKRYTYEIKSPYEGIAEDIGLLVDKYSTESGRYDINDKTVIIPKLKTGSKEVKYAIINAEILDDSGVQSEIKLGTGDNALTLVAQNLWIDTNNDTIFNINSMYIEEYNETKKELIMKSNYKYCITQSNTELLKNYEGLLQLVIYGLYIAQNLNGIKLFHFIALEYFSVLDIKSPFYGDLQLYDKKNDNYTNISICLSTKQLYYLNGNDIYFLFIDNTSITTPLSCITEELNINQIVTWHSLNETNEFNIHNLKKLKVTNLDIPKDHKLRNLDGDIEVTGNFIMEENSEIQCNTLSIV